MVLNIEGTDKQSAKNERAMVDLYNQETDELKNNFDIIELARIIHKHFQYLKSDWEEYTKSDLALAYAIKWNGYRKIPENAVVLMKEDWESEAYVRAMENDLCKKCRERIGEEYEKLLEKIRILEVQLDLERTRTLEEWLKIKEKQTAKRIYQIADEIATGSQNDGVNILCAIAQEFGLQV